MSAMMVQDRAIRVGINPVVARVTPVADLEAVMSVAEQLKLAVSRTDLMRAEGFGEDEIASVLTFVRGELAEPESLGADAMTPMDWAWS